MFIRNAIAQNKIWSCGYMFFCFFTEPKDVYCWDIQKGEKGIHYGDAGGNNEVIMSRM